MIEVTSEENTLDKTISLRAIGMGRYGDYELVIEGLPILKGTPFQILCQVMETIANEIITHDLSDGIIVSIGNYGHIRLVEQEGEDDKPRLYIRDVDTGSINANGFVGRLFALAGFDHMDSDELEGALELFSAGLQIQPDDAVLLHARASVTHDLLVKGEIESDRTARLFLNLFDDILRSIKLAPERPEAYQDLLVMLQSFQPIDHNKEEHKEWIFQIVELAISHPSNNPDVIDARNALRDFCQSYNTK